MPEIINWDELDETYEEAKIRVKAEYDHAYEECRNNWTSWDAQTRAKKFEEFLAYRNRNRIILWLESMDAVEPEEDDE